MILSESIWVVRDSPGVLIVEHRAGFIVANAGVDRSNVRGSPGGEMVLLLPETRTRRPRIYVRNGEALRKSLGVIVSDSFGRPWRQGTVGVALGAAGFPRSTIYAGGPTCSAVRSKSARLLWPTKSPRRRRC